MRLPRRLCELVGHVWLWHGMTEGGYWERCKRCGTVMRIPQ